MNNIILDTNFIVALVDESDVWNAKAIHLLNTFEQNNSNLIILDCVANEVISVLGKRMEDKHKSDEFNSVIDRALKYITTRLPHFVRCNFMFPRILNFYINNVLPKNISITLDKYDKNLL